MRIAIVHEHVDARRGGAETSILEMAGALSGIGGDVTIVTGRLGAENVAADSPVRLHAIPLHGSRLGRAIAFVGAADRFVSLYRSHRRWKD